MGDKIIAHGNNNIIVNRSSVLNAFNKIKDQYNEETANYLICIEKEINKSGNKEAIENYEAFTNELSKPAPLKSLLKSLWQGTVIALPTIVELAGAVESIEKLFN